MQHRGLILMGRIVPLWLAASFGLFVIVVVLYTTLRTSHVYSHVTAIPFSTTKSITLAPTVLRDDRQACIGPHGVVVGDVKDWVLTESVPKPYAGSYVELGLEHTWSTAAERYAPYGFYTDERNTTTWPPVDWAQLQNECLYANMRLGYNGTVPSLVASRRLRKPTWKEQGHFLFSSATKPRPKVFTGRTAILYRGWDEFEFKDEDYWTLRALIAETSLRSKGEYAVFYLVDVKGDFDVMNNASDYERVLHSVPAEFRNMTVLFDHALLEAWYPRVPEHRPEWQMEQARQLFAHIFDEFDHYWTIELDIRFTGNSGKMFKAFENFARGEPRKQARERSSFFLTSVYGTYANLSASVDRVLDGGSAFWRGTPIPDVHTTGPEPPTQRPEDDAFRWGVGEEADLILLSSTFNVTLAPAWHYKQWIFGFRNGIRTPRIASAPAVSRCSWNLLNLIHESQVWNGLSVPSEATPASFALWGGMKMSRVPFPMYGEHAHLYSSEEIDLFLNGGSPSRMHDGMAWGRNAYGVTFGQGDGIASEGLGPTWRWNAGFPGHLFDSWIQGNVEAATRLPMQQVRAGMVMMPNLMLHPVKSNQKPSPHLGH